MNPHAEADSGLEGPERVAVRTTRPSLLSLMVEAGVAEESELRELAEEARQRGLRFGELAIARGWLDDEELGRIVAAQWRLPFLDRETLTLDPAAAFLLPAEQARSLDGCVICFRDDGPLVAVAEPTTERLDELRRELSATTAGAPVSFAIVSQSSLEALQQQLARLGASTPTPSPQQQPPPSAGPGPKEPDASRPNLSDRPAAPSAVNTDAEAAMVEALLASLEQASSSLPTLRERVERLGAARRESEEQAADLRRARDTAGEEATRQQERVRELEHTLDRERERAQAFRQRLVDLLAEFDQSATKSPPS